MQFPHRGMVGFVAGIALGIGGTVMSERLLDQRVTKPSEPQARAIPALTSRLLLQEEPALGDPNAPLTIVEFSDFECSYCRRFHEQVMPQLKRSYTTPVWCDLSTKICLYPSTPLLAGSRSSTLCRRAKPLLGPLQTPVRRAELPGVQRRSCHRRGGRAQHIKTASLHGRGSDLGPYQCKPLGSITAQHQRHTELRHRPNPKRREPGWTGH